MIKALPVNLVITLASLFNVVFTSGFYPSAWSVARMFTVFKSGSRKNVKNYRPITVMDSLAKLCDMVLVNRLNLWFTPFREQAGSQKGRGCVEHIVALRLITDLCKRKKLLLYVSFVDFSAAYDRVPRKRLFTMLRDLGCVAVMLAALVAVYSVTRSVLGAAIITTAVGVRQGSSTSCLLFMLFVNDLIGLIKGRCGRDGILEWLHVLMYMDDTVLLSTTREGMHFKLGLLQKWCINNAMKVNTDKTKNFAINGSERDRIPFILEQFNIKNINKRAGDIVWAEAAAQVAAKRSGSEDLRGRGNK